MKDKTDALKENIAKLEESIDKKKKDTYPAPTERNMTLGGAIIKPVAKAITKTFQEKIGGDKKQDVKNLDKDKNQKKPASLTEQKKSLNVAVAQIDPLHPTGLEPPPKDPQYEVPT